MAQAISSPTPSDFLAQLLAPLNGSPAERRQFVAEQRREAEMAWRIAYHRYHAATAYEESCVHAQRAAELTGRVVKDPPTAAAHAQAGLDRLSAIDRLMMTPAPDMVALRMKRKMRRCDGGRDRWEAAIIADEARLERK